MRIAIIKLGALGDVLRTTSLLRPLHKAYPGCEIWWYALLSALPLLQRNHWITRSIPFDSPPVTVADQASFDLNIVGCP